MLHPQGEQLEQAKYAKKELKVLAPGSNNTVYSRFIMHLNNTDIVKVVKM